MKLEEIERIVGQLDPRDQSRLADGISRHLKVTPPTNESAEARRARRLAVLARCDEFAGPDGDQDSTNDLRAIRNERMTDTG